MFLIFTFSTCKTLPCLRYISANIWKPLKMLTVLSFLHYSSQHSYLACNPSSKSSLQDFRLLLCLIWNFLAKTRIFPFISFVFKWQNMEWKLWNFLDFLQMKFPSTKSLKIDFLSWKLYGVFTAFDDCLLPHHQHLLSLLLSECNEKIKKKKWSLLFSCLSASDVERLFSKKKNIL